MEDKDENWIPCFGERCKDRNLYVDFNPDDEVNMISCGPERYDSVLFIEYDENKEKSIIEDDLCRCLYKLEWYACEFGVFRKRDDMVERMRSMGFKIEIDENEGIAKYMRCIRKNIGDKNEKDS